MPFTRRPGSGRPRQSSRREVRHIVKKALVQPTASSTAIQAQAPYHRHLRLERCRAQGNWTTAVMEPGRFSDESRFNLNSDYNRVRV
ncbi:transposable element Tcb2 transposase [Trichonephila clavipes]|nr:transposable element Tcb2 transposase [Trichonephila clavipes]